MSKSALNARLLSAAGLVRQGAVFADIGTDHAYLPLFLLEEGRIERAFCSDINEGPLASAERNAKERGLYDKITFTLADGIEALSGKGITDYAICGMGGELIADIIARAPELKAEGVNLILQPMTRQAHLRKFLLSEGFSVLLESYSMDSGRYYVTLLATYTGENRNIDDAEAEIGIKCAEIVNKNIHKCYLLEKRRAISKKANGKIRGGESAEQELSLLSSIDRHIKEKNYGEENDS